MTVCDYRRRCWIVAVAHRNSFFKEGRALRGTMRFPLPAFIVYVMPVIPLRLGAFGWVIVNRVTRLAIIWSFPRGLGGLFLVWFAYGKLRGKIFSRRHLILEQFSKRPLLVAIFLMGLWRDSWLNSATFTVDTMILMGSLAIMARRNKWEFGVWEWVCLLSVGVGVSYACVVGWKA